MAGISSKEAGKLENKYKNNGEEINNKEFSNGAGLETYDFSARNYDPQIGRRHIMDPKADLFEMSSPFVYCYNNPIKFKDPDGQLAILINGSVPDESQRGNASYWDPGIIDAIKNSGIPYSSNINFVDGDKFRRHEWYGSKAIMMSGARSKMELSCKGIILTVGEMQVMNLGKKISNPY